MPRVLKPENLNPIKDSEVARKLQRNSVIKRKENQAKKLLIKEVLEARLSTADLNEMVDNLISRAKRNDNSFDVLRDTIGQKANKIEATVTTYEDKLKESVGDDEF